MSGSEHEAVFGNNDPASGTVLRLDGDDGSLNLGQQGLHAFLNFKQVLRAGRNRLIPRPFLSFICQKKGVKKKCAEKNYGVATHKTIEPS